MEHLKVNIYNCKIYQLDTVKSELCKSIGCLWAYIMSVYLFKMFLVLLVKIGHNMHGIVRF